MTAALNRAERRRAGKATNKAPDPAVSAAPVTMSLRNALVTATRHHQSGNLDAAESVYRAVLQAAPENVDALQLLGVLAYQRGREKKAFDLLERARALAPDNVEVLANYSAVLVQAERHAEGEEILRRVLEIQPEHLEARLNLVRVLASDGRTPAAVSLCEEGIALQPHAAALHRILGEILLKVRDFARAADAFLAGLALDPADIASMNDLAICCRELGDPVQAERWYQEAIAGDPGRAEIRYNFGAFLLGLGRVEEAREHLDKVLADKPDHWMTLAMLALNLIKMGNEREAIETLHQVAAAHPDDANVWNDVGALFMDMGKFEEAAAHFARAAEIDPELVEPQTNLGNAYLKQNFCLDAIAAYNKALKIRPLHLEAHVAMCRAFRDLYRLDEANVYAHATLMLHNYGPKYFSNPLQVFRSTCDYAGLKELGDMWEILDKVQGVDVTTALLQLLCYAVDDETTRRLAGHARRWSEVVEAQAAAAPLPPRTGRAAKPKLRIGILSSDLRTHSVARFVMPLIRNYDREKFEFFCYCPIRHDLDQIQAHFKAAADKFVFVDNKTDRETAQIIQNDDVDILLELNGFTHGTKLAAMAYRPAPVQIAWLGYPFTTTLKAMDYVLVDEHFKPRADGGLVEKPLVMPGSWVCLGEGTLFDAVDIGASPVDRDGIVTFGTLNNTYKYTPRMIALWAEAMKRVPNSRFLVVRPECGSMIACSNIAKAFAEHGISSDRLYFLNNRATGTPHLACYNEIDITLDTFPLTGGTTSMEALWMGVPVVTLAGPNLHQRISYALLKHVGLDECCAESPEEYVDRAVALAQNVERIRELRANLRGMVKASPLAQPELFAQNFQTAMMELAVKHGLR